VSEDVLTDLERRMLAFVTGYVSERGNGPTLAEIGNACGVRSVGTVHRYIRSIESKGFLKKVRQGWRPRKPAKEMSMTGDGRTAWHGEYSRKVYELNKANEEIDSLRNQLEIAKEDIECAHMSLDDVGAPREIDGKPLSIIGRVRAKYESS
jgi:SOS-response transcriptional repressor LexA